MAPRPYVLGDITYRAARDTLEAERIAAEAGRAAWELSARVIVLPAVPFGVHTGQLDVPFCLNLNPSTQLLILKDLAQVLAGQGLKKLVILNGHGGNDFRQMIRELLPVIPLFICTVNWYEIVDPKPYFDDPGDHAGELETSVTMHLAPDLVSPLSEAGSGQARGFKLKAFQEGWAWAPRRWTQVTKDTGVGNPARATPQKGARYLEAVTRKIAEFLVELARADVDDLYR
jgi:creatinine amidohydrolase